MQRTIPRAGLLLACAGMAMLAPAWRAGAQSASELIGQVSGSDIAVKGAVSVSVENGRSSTVLGSGGEISVRSGQARLDLVDGGQIEICAPAHLKLLKAGGAITVALEFGRLRVILPGALPLSVYTPLIVATPVPVGGATRELTLGLEPSGALCASAAGGAARLEEQLSGQSLEVPQGSAMELPSGRLDSIRATQGSCACPAAEGKAQPETARKAMETSTAVSASEEKTTEKGAAPAPQTPAQPVVAIPPAPAPAPAAEVKGREVAGERKAPAGLPATELPVWRVVMPPLIFDAHAPTPPPDPSPEVIVLIREVRVTPEMLFRGTVLPRRARVELAKDRASVHSPESAGTKPKPPGFFDWLRNLFHGKASAPRPCAGAGCESHGA